MDVSFSCVCPVIDHEFRHNIVKVAVDSRGDGQVDLQTWKTDVNLLNRHFKSREFASGLTSLLVEKKTSLALLCKSTKRFNFEPWNIH